MDLDCFIIHLARATERAAQVAATQAALPLRCHVLPAVDGQSMSAAEARAYQPGLLAPPYPFDLRASEVATFHSHRAAWRRIVDGALPAALIIEDDLEIDTDVFLPALDLACTHMRGGDFVRFPIKPREDAGTQIAHRGAVRLGCHDAVALGMVAQLVTLKAAQRLLDATERFDRPVDTFLQMTWVHGVRILTAWPTGIEEVSARLGGSLIQRKEGALQKLRREVLRPIYRRRIAAMARKHPNG
ncbi:glycosyltransferase family 25 protein [Roseovarius nanhaiticus]|uniref:glycosyltransferase family 25 protein n=1 Tax=Roseovarius nanhaiticus TaxID=573024 RepID=UPI00248FC18C|nr:glycosyltransferase family 25 protein [Roseovarius nanhaiticus]